jgi:alpha-amylase
VRLLRVVAAAAVLLGIVAPVRLLTASGAIEASSVTAAVDWRDESIYMVMTDRFRNGDPSNDGDADPARADWWHGGDLQGVIDELEYIKGLGMTAIWITPVTAQMSGGYHGYWTSDFYTVDPHLGDLSKLRELVTRAHAIGLKIVLDVVFNHVGQRNPWLTDGQHAGWFHGDCPINFADQGTVERCWLAGLPDLNTENPVVRTYLKDWALWLVAETDVDGFRVDAARHLPKDFISELVSTLKASHPRFWVLGEIFSSGYRYQSGYLASGLDAVTDFQTYESLGIALARSGNISQLTLPPGLAADLGPGRDDLRATFIDNHDVARFVGADPPDADARARLAQALAYLFTVPGTPVLYYGTEIALAGGRDPDDRRSMPWTGGDVATRDLVQQLALLRRDTPALRRGSFVELVSERSAAAYARVLGDERIVVAFNADPTDARSVQVPLGPLGLSTATAEPLAVTAAGLRAVGDGLEIGLAPRGYAVLRLLPAPTGGAPAWAIVASLLAIVLAITVLLGRSRLRRG